MRSLATSITQEQLHLVDLWCAIKRLIPIERLIALN